MVAHFLVMAAISWLSCCVFSLYLSFLGVRIGHVRPDFDRPKSDLRKNLQV